MLANNDCILLVSFGRIVFSLSLTRLSHWTFDRSSGHECSVDIQAQSCRDRCSKLRSCERQPASHFIMVATDKNAMESKKVMKAMKARKARTVKRSMKDIKRSMKDKGNIHGRGVKARTAMKANNATTAWDAI